ncbi:thiamine pyrophosphate-binding protein [Nonomuraea sp. NPDC050310]|uniref:thiamine pyrophosphate-binding protein n=1 Tax=Nonomuraea sp. NPDC050310 TaxID=3154935 RepID=UPI0033EB1C40
MTMTRHHPAPATSVPPRTVAEVAGRLLATLGVTTCFGVVGSGNFHLTNALIAAGVPFVAARHEGGAVTMADAYARTSGALVAVSVHQGPGFTNALTGLTEAAKSRTPLLVLAPETANPRSNFAVDQEAIVRATGALYLRVSRPESAADVLVSAVRQARAGRGTVVVGLPLHVLAAPATGEPRSVPMPLAAPAEPAAERDVATLAEALATAERPVIVAGRGARDAQPYLERLADRVGALPATSAAAHGLFAGHDFDLGLLGGFSTPAVADLAAEADLVVAWGCSLTGWTTRHGRLIHPAARVIHVDHRPEGLAATHPRTGAGAEVIGGDCARTAVAVLDALGGRLPYAREGYRTPAVRERLRAGRRWNRLPIADPATEAGRVDPRALAARLDRLLPEERTLVTDSGAFMGYPIAYLDVPDEAGFCFTQAFQSIGLGLATGIGAALARPDRLTVAALGDGGALMGMADLETAVRLRLPLLVVVFNDDAYGAEVHHFTGHPLDAVTFPEVDLAAIAAGYGCAAATVRDLAGLAAVTDWLREPTRPLLVDAKVSRELTPWWLEDAFVGHSAPPAPAAGTAAGHAP